MTVTKSPRRRRSERPTKRAGCLTSRDLDLLTFIGRSKVAPTNAIASAFFPDRSTASRRLGRLLGAGYLRVHVEGLNESNLYALSERAEETLVAEGVDAESLHLGRFPKRDALEHLRLLAEFYASLLAATRIRPDVRLDLWLADHDLRRLAGAQVPPYVPDALVRLAPPRGTVGLCLEFDCGHETATGIASTKGRVTRLATEQKLPMWGLWPWRPVFIAPSAARLRSVAQALHAEGAAALWLGTTMDLLARVGPLGQAYGSVARIVDTPRDQPLPLDLAVTDLAMRDAR